jgi:hypothetical protein
VCNTYQRSVGDSAERVAGRTDFLVNLEPSAETVMCQLRFVESGEELLTLDGRKSSSVAGGPMGTWLGGDYVGVSD